MVADEASSWLEGPHRRVANFAGKVLAFYALWYILYDLWLLPNGTLDRWLSLNVAWVGGIFLEAVGIEATIDGRLLALAGSPGVRIANGCNGISTLGLFIGFVFAYPGSQFRRLLFIPIGVAIIYATNVGRVIAMLLVQKYWPVAFDPLHGFGLTTIFYVVVFALWMIWVNYGSSDTSLLENTSSSDRPTAVPSP